MARGKQPNGQATYFHVGMVVRPIARLTSQYGTTGLRRRSAGTRPVRCEAAVYGTTRLPKVRVTHREEERAAKKARSAKHP